MKVFLITLLVISIYKIFRANNNNRRKGVAILVSIYLDVEVSKILEDPDGRYVKIRIKNREDERTYTMSSIYVEPDNQDNYQMVIPRYALEADYVAGDMNEVNSGFQRWKVFHYNNITIEDQISLATNILDLVIQSTTIEDLQEIYDKIKIELKKLDMSINTQKCELISNDMADVLTDEDGNIEIEAQEDARYLGQVINNEGLATCNISNVMFVHIST